MPGGNSPGFLPALSHRRLAPLYDPLLRWVMREDVFKRRLITNARLAGTLVLDLGSGTGTLTVLAKRSHPEVTVVGPDADAEILSRARANAARSGAAIPWVQGLADRLPYAEATFDRVLICLVLHHLAPEDRLRSLREVLRVLRPDGEVHIADFGPPRTPAMRLLAPVIRRLEQTADLIDGRLPVMLGAAGFRSVKETSRFESPLGPVVLLCAVKTLEKVGLPFQRA